MRARKGGRWLSLVCSSLLSILLVAGCSGGDGDSDSGTVAAPVAEAGPDQDVATGSLVTLDGSASGSVAYHWSFDSLPEHSAATLSDPTDAKATFTADEDGVYVLNLAVRSGEVNGLADQVIIRAGGPIDRLDYLVTDAEFNKTTDEIVIVSTTGNRLHIYNPLTKADQSVELPLIPACVSVGPEGLFAAIGHDGWISYVDLEASALLKTMPVTGDIFDVVLAGNGFVYAFPGGNDTQGMRCIEVSTGTESTLAKHFIRAETRAKLHPNGMNIYATGTRTTPSSIEKYNISRGTARFLHGSLSPGDYQVCGNLWISEDGLRIFGRCANTFWASGIRDEDMTYAGSIGDLTGVRCVDHSTETDQVVVIPRNDASEIQFFDATYLAFKSATPFPKFVLGDKTFPSHGRYVFYSGDGSRIFAIVEADASSGLLFGFGIVAF